MTASAFAPTTPRLPPVPLAWALTLAGLAALLLSAWLSGEAFATLFGRPVRAGGGEFFVALAGGLPAFALGALLLGVCAWRPVWRSGLAMFGAVVAGAMGLAWGVALGRWW